MFDRSATVYVIKNFELNSRKVPPPMFHSVEYRFTLPTGETHTFCVDLCDIVREPSIDEPAPPEWTTLAFHKCPGCPLSSLEITHCPAAQDIHRVVDTFSSIMSHTEAEIQVVTPQRSYHKSCDVQTGLGALLGLLMAGSGCPVLSKLKAMAHFHLPFASLDETIFRTVGTYLIQQYLVAQDGGTPDFELKHLKDLYEELESLNNAMAQRLRNAAECDASVNAIVGFFGVSYLVRDSIDEQLQSFKVLYDCP